MKSILYFGDQPITLEGLRTVLASTPDIELAGHCSTPADLAAFAADPPIDPVLVLVDVEASFHLLALQEIKSAAGSLPIVLWIDAIGAEFAFQAFLSGVRGIVPKSLPIDAQLSALRKVLAGEPWFEKAISDGFLSSRREHVSVRESQIIALLAQGRKNKDIAFRMGICEGTVKVYFSRLFKKLGCNDRLELALWGLKNLGDISRLDGAQRNGPLLLAIPQTLAA